MPISIYLLYMVSIEMIKIIPLYYGDVIRL